MLENASMGTDGILINRGVSGELAATAVCMKNEVALDEPGLMLWQVGSNNALTLRGRRRIRAQRGRIRLPGAIQGERHHARRHCQAHAAPAASR